MGKALVFQLIDQSIPGETGIIQIALGGFCGLLIPVRAAVVCAVGGFFGGEFLILQLINQAGVRKGSIIQIAFGRFQCLLIPVRTTVVCGIDGIF